MFKKRENADSSKELFLSLFEPLTKYENLQTEDCDGRVVTKDIIANINVPSYRRAAMDGYAVISKDTLGASSTSPVILKISENVSFGVCKWVHTGSPLPDNADAVVMVEDTVLYDDNVEIYVQVHPFKNVSEIGEDIQKGEIIVKAKSKLRPCDIGVLASLGIKTVYVYKKPIVAIIPTGEEIVSREKTHLEKGEVYETNGLMTKLYVKKWGGIPKLFDIVPDSKEKIKQAIISSFDSDMIIISGGTSVGKRDYVVDVVKELGNLCVHGVGISPGKPTALGIIENKPVLCMPGYPVAGIIALFWFGKPALLKLRNIYNEYEKKVYAVLSEKITSRIGFKTFVRVKLENGKAIPLATYGAGILSSVSKADGFVIIPETHEGLNKGDKVEVLLID